MINDTTRPTKGRSLRTTYLILAFVISGILITGSLIATHYISNLNRNSAESIQIRNTASEIIRNIRNHVWSVESSLNSIFISHTMADRQALLKQLDMAIEESALLQQLKTIESTSLDAPASELHSDLNEFKSKLIELVEKSKDLNWVYPVLPYISDTLLKSNKDFNTAISIALDEIGNEDTNTQTTQLYREVTELNDLWRRQILDFRAILIRIVGLNQTANLAQANNLKLRQQVILDKIDKIENLYKQDPFGFDTEEAIKTMRLRANKWFSDYQEFGKILNSNIWRSDIHFIKTKILPIQRSVANKLTGMEQIVQNWSTLNVNRVESAASTVIIELWALAIISLAFVGMVYHILSRTLLKPISQLSDDLTNDISKTDSQPLATHGKGLLFNSKEVHSLLDSYNDMKQIINTRDQELKQINHDLEEQVQKRTAELETSINELKTFNYSVSHDLRSPLRSIDGFSLALLEDYEDQLDETGKDYLRRIRNNSQRMGELIDDMLKLSAVSRKDINREVVNLSTIANNIFEMYKEQQPERETEILIENNIAAEGDKQLLQIVLENLIGNAWKYSHKKPKAQIQFGITHHSDRNVYFVKDNGAGFNMDYANKLFGVFQRLHGNEYEGTGIGLATVKRIIERHGGDIWAQSKENIGSTFYFTLA